MPDASEIREFIVKYFTLAELESFCFGNFSDVYHDLNGAGKTLTKYAEHLVTYCKNNNEIEKLLVDLQKARPDAYTKHFPSPLEPPEDPQKPQPVRPDPPKEKILLWLFVFITIVFVSLVVFVIVTNLISTVTDPPLTPNAPASVTTAQSMAKPVDTPEATPVSSATQIVPTARPTAIASRGAVDLPLLINIPDLVESCPGRLETGLDSVQLRLIVDAGYVAYLHGDDISMSSGEKLTSTLVSVFGPYDAAVTVRNGVFCAPVPAGSTQADETRIDMQNECDGCQTMEIRREEKQP